MRRLLHMVGNAHIDPVWLWQWTEGYAEVRATFQSAIDRMDEYPDFIFTCNSVVFFAWVEESDPQLFERIKARIAEGRWQVVGGWWVEPDCNLPAGESFARHALYGQRYLRSRFGITATVGANIDSFGHNATIPQLLRKAGMDSYVFLRPGAGELELPTVFWWEAPDGSRVLAYRIPHEYCGPRGELGEHVEQALAQLPEDDDELMVFYGVGNHGGGPTKANLDSIARLNEAGELPRLQLSSPRAFFDAVGQNGDHPVYRGELQHHAVGCYTSHSGIKRWNRRAENELLRAEKWCAVAASLELQHDPLEELATAWKLLLLNQFHDTLGGTSIAPAYEDARDQVGHARSLASAAFNRAVQSISRQIDIPLDEDMRPVVVFNSHPWPVRADVEVEYTWLREDLLHALDEDGAAVPLQLTRPLTTMSGRRGRVVLTADLPALGYRVYRLARGGVSATAVHATETSLENELVRLELSPTTGRITRLELRSTGANLADPGAKHAVVLHDCSDTWGHGVEGYVDEAGEFECTQVRLLETGPVRAIIRAESRYGGSTLREDYVLSAAAGYVDVRVTVDWREQHKLLKLRYPTAIDVAHATYETPYGHLERPADGDERPGQAWVDVSGESSGLAVLNDAKYGFDVRDGTIGVTVVRSPVWTWHDPRELEPDGDFEYMDQGRQQFLLRLVPHAGEWRDADLARRAAELNQPPFALIETYHAGPLPQSASYASDGGGPVVMSVLKGAEDGGGALVVRAYETSGEAIDATIELPLAGRTIRKRFGPGEIRTFHVPKDANDPCREVNLLEW